MGFMGTSQPTSGASIPGKMLMRAIFLCLPYARKPVQNIIPTEN